MQYEIIQQDQRYRIVYTQGDKRVLSSHLFNTEDEAVRYIFNTGHTANAAVNIRTNNGHHVKGSFSP